MVVLLSKAKDIQTQPFEAGSSRFNLVDVVSQEQDAPVSAGMAEIWKSAPIEFDYDNDCAVCYMIDGEISLTEENTRYDFTPGDVVFIPQRKGLKVLWATETYGRFFYVTYPHWR